MLDREAVDPAGTALADELIRAAGRFRDRRLGPTAWLTLLDKGAEAARGRVRRAAR